MISVISVSYLDNVLSLFRTYLTQKKVSRRSADNYTSDIRHFLRWLDRALPPGAPFVLPQELYTAITQKDIENFGMELRMAGKPTTCINRTLSSLRAFMSLGVTHQWIDINVAQLVPNLSPTSMPHNVTDRKHITPSVPVSTPPANQVPTHRLPHPIPPEILPTSSSTRNTS